MAAVAAVTRRTTLGIEVRHGRACPADAGGRCSCRPSYRAWVWSRRDGKRVRRTFPTLAAAKSWRSDAVGAVRRGTVRPVESITLRQAADSFLWGAKQGTILARGRKPYKPSALRGYESALERRILPELGGAKLADVTRHDLQDLADRMLAEGLDPSTIRNALMPLRAVYRRAIARGEVAVNPTAGLELPAVEGRRDRVASPTEAAELLAALPESDRALWATAMYAGLRRGELMALRWEDVDLAAGIIRVERSWDPKARVFVEPKSRAGRRNVPIASALRGFLVEHKLRRGGGSELVFGRVEGVPFDDSSLSARAATAWRRETQRRALELAGEGCSEREYAAAVAKVGLVPIGLHEARHTFASLMIAAGVNAKALSSYLGHSSITITLDRYGHLFPGNEDEAAGLLDAYLERANTETRLAHG